MKGKANQGWWEPDVSSDLPNITSELQAECYSVNIFIIPIISRRCRFCHVKAGAYKTRVSMQ